MTTAKLPGNWTPEKLAALSPRDRFRLRESTRNTTLGTAEGRAALDDAIVKSGPLYDSSAITNDDPLSIEMERIINTPEGRAACLAATAAGLPALAGVEPMIVKEVGEVYGRKYMATQQAGSLVGKLMKAMNYEIIAQKPMPNGSVAQTATLWGPKRR